MARKRTIYLPDELAEQVDRYLEMYPRKSFSTLVQEALKARVAPRDPRAILKLAGFVESGARDDSDDERFRDRPEDRVVLHER